MPLTDSQYTVRLPLPDLIVRGRSHVLRAPVYRAGALMSPASATVTVYDGSGNAVAAITSAAATITASVATYTISANTLSSYPLGEGWQVEWVITLSDGTVLPVVNSAALVRIALLPVVTDLDLYRRVPALDPSRADAQESRQSYQDTLDEAWTEIQLRMISRGNRPNLIREPSALRACHLYLTLALIYEGEETRLAQAYGDQATYYRGLYEQAWGELNPQYATTDERMADTRRRSMSPTIWLNGGAGRTTKNWN